MENIFEQQRRLHEEIEILEMAATNCLVELDEAGTTKGRKEIIYSEHRVRKLVEDIQEKSAKLYELYEDNDGSRKDMLKAITCGDDFTEFYNRMDYYSRYFKMNPYQMVELPDVTYDNEPEGYANGKVLVSFTDEEGYGRFLDLQELHNQYQNLGDIEKLSYLQYLNTFDRFENIPAHKKTHQTYKSYLGNLLTYLKDIYTRAMPLEDLEMELVKAGDVFEKEWEEGTLPGWEHAAEEDDSPANMFCIACQHQFAKATVFKAHLTGKKHLKAIERLKASGGTENLNIREEKKKHDDVERSKKMAIAKMEVEIAYLADLLEEQRKQTHTNVERKQARTTTELEDDDVDDVILEEEDDDDDEKAPYNPKNLPMGWDGKPIPYWLYKLHGLNITYTCEICAGAQYKGPKMFQKHFQEGKHAFGMKQLGIPNTIHFQNVTSKEDAIA
eukprot:Ihof_evm2s369 gene=Ihof_evmTU2s369